MTLTNDSQLPTSRLFDHCPVCGNTELDQTPAILAEGPLLRCGACGQLLSSCSVQQHDDALGKWDVASGTNPDEKSKKRYRKVTVRRLQTAMRLLQTEPRGCSFLDVGCSSGALLGVAVSQGLTVWGVEPAAAAAESAQKAGFNVVAGFLHDAAYPDNQFDIITLFEIVEHLRDPVSMLKECRRILKPGGILAINTPNAASWTARFMGARWEGFSLLGLGGHASFFSPRSMQTLASVCGLRVVRTETRNVRFFESGQCPPRSFKIAKVIAQLLALPARVLGQGHDLLVFLRKE